MYTVLHILQSRLASVFYNKVKNKPRKVYDHESVLSNLLILEGTHLSFAMIVITAMIDDRIIYQIKLNCLLSVLLQFEIMFA